MHIFNWADYAIVSIIGLSVLISLVRGFVREALSLVTWVAAIWVAFTFYSNLSELLVNMIHSDTLRMISSFGMLFIATLILGAIVNFLISQLIDKTGLSGTDRMLGLIFGAARGTLIVTLLLMLANLTPMPKEKWWQESLLIPQFHSLEVWLHDILPASVTQHLQSGN